MRFPGPPRQKKSPETKIFTSFKGTTAIFALHDFCKEFDGEMENFALAIIFRQLEVSGHLREKASLLSGQQVNSLPHPRHKSANSMHKCKYMKYFRKSIPSNRQSSVSLLAVTEEHLSTLLLCRKKIRQSNRRTSVHFVTLSTFYTLYLFDKTRVEETGKRERKDGSRRPEEHRWEVKKAGCPGERLHRRVQTGEMTTRNGPDGFLEEAL